MPHPQGRRPDARGYAKERVVGGRPERDDTGPVRSLLVFFAMWLMLGFVGGTALLMGPVRWVASYARESDWSGPLESVTMLLLMTGFALLAAYLAYGLERWRRRRGALVGWGTPLILVGLSGATLWVWLNPAPVPGEIDAALGGRFLFGPYPTPELMNELEARGVTTIVSLLHPAVVPFEPRLLRLEREAAEAVGLDFVSAPMLPWVSTNRASLAALRRLAVHGEGKYYVHCYFGRDRIEFARDAIVQAVEDAKLENRLRAWGPFERGPIRELGNEIFVTPFPTPPEMSEFYADGSAAAVLSLLDPEHEEDRPWLEQERIALAASDVELHVAPIATSPFDPREAVAAARLARRLPRPLLVHAFLSEGPATEAFVRAYESGRAPASPDLEGDSLSGGPIRLVAAHVAIGPRPVTREFGRLYNRGIRTVAGLANVGAVDRFLAETAGLAWWEGSSEELLEALEGGGPWYVYGSEDTSLEQRITERFGAPESVGPERHIDGQNEEQFDGG